MSQYLIATAVDAQLCRKGDTTDQEEEGVERIRNQHEQWIDGKSFIDGSCDEVQK